MEAYIQTLANKLSSASCWEEQYEIVEQLNREKASCYRILEEYKDREIKCSVFCPKVIAHEQHIIRQIDLILNNK